MNASSSDAKTIFGRAIEIEDAAARAAYVDQACGSNAQLRTEIDGLIGAHFKVGDFLKGPARNAATCLDEAGSGEEGMVIGPYKLLERIGEGGMGVVFMADQHAPVRRRVALKIIKPGMDTREVLARFDAERQALALMDHPNIARALDAGATDSGRPYFVMELVRGVPITDYCDQNNLAVHERLALFVDVCRAVQHAHQKGVIHRDIKPTNILVTQIDGRPVPKVIDFGVAKAIHQPLTEQTLFTRFAEMVGTPLYMSPEQAAMTALDIDTRSDIYSLGVLLYELLTGTTPFDKDRLKQAAYDEVRRIIREEEPATPSTRISSLGAKSGVVAAHRHADPRGLSQLVRGDLDWIVMKALEKERSRRYETAIGLAMDVERHLADEPVQACPPSAFYKFRKFARRNRVAFATSIVVLAAILAGTAVSVTQAIRATHAEHLAQTRLQAETEARNEAEAARQAEAAQRRIAETQSAIAEAQKRQAEANFHKARQAVDEYFTLVSESQLLNVPGLQPLRKQLLEAALRYYQGFLEQRSADPNVRAELVGTYLRVAQVDMQNDRTDDSIRTLKKALGILEPLLREKPRVADFRQFAGFRRSGRILQFFEMWPSDVAEAVRVSQQAVVIWEQLVREYPDSEGFQSDLASFYHYFGDLNCLIKRPVDALQLFQKACRIWEQLVARHPKNPEYRSGLADDLEYAANQPPLPIPERDADCRRALSLREGLVSEFPAVPEYRAGLANGLRRFAFLGTHKSAAEAESVQIRSLELWEKLVAEYPAYPGFRKRLGDMYLTRSRSTRNSARAQQAERYLRQAVATLAKLASDDPGEQGDNLMELVGAQSSLISFLSESGRQKEAESVLRDQAAAMEVMNRLASQASGWQRHAGDGNRHLGRNARDLGRLDVAERAYRRALPALEKPPASGISFLENRRLLADTHLQLAHILVAARRPDDAEKEFHLAIDIQEAFEKLPVEPFDQGEWPTSDLDLSRFLQSRGRTDAAAQVLRRLISRTEALASAFPENAVFRQRLARVHHDLANSFRDARRMGDAEPHYREAFVSYDALVAASATNPEYQFKRAQCHRDFALMLTWAGRPVDGEREYREAIAIFKKLVAAAPADVESRFYLAHSCCALADLVSNNKRTQEAEDFFRQGRALFEKLAADCPARDNFRVDLGHTLWHLAELAAAAGRPKEAEQDHRRALAIFEKLAADIPQNRYYQWEQGWSDLHLAGLMQQLNRLPEAEKSFQDAADVYAKMVADMPADGGPPNRLAQLEFDFAELLRTEKRLDDAEKHYRLAEAAWRKLAADNPTEPVYRIRALGTRANQLSPLLTAKGRAREAEENYREAVGLLASLPASELVADDRRDLTDACYGNLIRLLKSSNRPQEATAVFRAWRDLHRKTFTKSLEQNPKSAEAQNHLGEALARLGCWDEAAAAIDKAADLDPTNHMFLYQAAPLHLRAGDVAGYRRLSRTMLDRFQEAKEPIVADRTAKTCSLAPGAVPDFDRVQKLADRIVTGTEKDAAYRAFVLVKGLAEYRAGRQAEALKWLERFGPHADGSQDVVAFAVLAMAQHRLGHQEKAGAALKSAQAIFAEKMPDPAAGRPFDVLWQNWLQCQILLREAESLLNAKPDADHKSETKRRPPTNAAATSRPARKP